MLTNGLKDYITQLERGIRFREDGRKTILLSEKGKNGITISLGLIKR